MSLLFSHGSNRKTFRVSDNTDADDQVVITAAVSTVPCFFNSSSGVFSQTAAALESNKSEVCLLTQSISFLHGVMNTSQTQNITQLVTLKCKSIMQV